MGGGDKKNFALFFDIAPPLPRDKNKRVSKKTQKKPLSITLLYQHNLKHIAEFREDLVQGIDANGIDEAGDQRLDHAAVAAVLYTIYIP